MRIVCEGTGCKDVCGLVEGTAHVDGHHAGQNQAEQDGIARAEVIQKVRDPDVDR